MNKRTINALYTAAYNADHASTVAFEAYGKAKLAARGDRTAISHAAYYIREPARELQTKAAAYIKRARAWSH